MLKQAKVVGDSASKSTGTNVPVDEKRQGRFGLGAKDVVDRRVVKAQRFREIVEDLAGGLPVVDEQVGKDLRRFFNDPTLSLEAALGIAASPGERSWRRVEQLQIYREAIRSIDSLIAIDDVSRRERIRGVQVRLRAYETGAWKRTDQARLGVMPTDYQDTINEQLFRACEARRQLRILARLDSKSRDPGLSLDSEPTLARLLSI